MQLYLNNDPVKGPRNPSSTLGKLWDSRLRLPVAMFDEVAASFGSRGGAHSSTSPGWD